MARPCHAGHESGGRNDLDFPSRFTTRFTLITSSVVLTRYSRKPRRLWMKICSSRSFVCLLLLTGSAFTADQYEVVIQRGVETKMRDGVILRSDIYRPKAEGKFPILLQRTPYNKEGDDF